MGRCVLRGKSPDVVLSNAEEKVFMVVPVLLLLSANYQRVVFAKLRFQISHRQYEAREVADDTSRLLVES